MSMDPIYLLVHSNDLLNIIKFLWLPLTVMFQVSPVGPGIKIKVVGKKIKHERNSVHSFTIRAQVICQQFSYMGNLKTKPNNHHHLLHLDRNVQIYKLSV